MGNILHRRARKIGRYAVLLSSVFAVSPLHAQETTGVEDIIVTAQKREQNLQTVPISITALTQDTIKANRIQDVRDLNAIAPNLTVRLSGGGGQIPNFTLRGLFTQGVSLGTDKGVALYLDGVYIQSVIGSVFDFADIERIEVLKGPQGTLFGRNATGGAISITTRNPTGSFSFKQDLSYGNYDQLRSKTRVDLPQVGPFSATVTYLHSERRGDTRNLGAGTTYDYGPATGGAMGKRTSPKYLGSDNVEAVQATVKADLIDNLNLIYKFDYSENNFTPTAAGIDYLPAGTPVDQLYRASPNQMTPISKKRPKAVNNSFTTPSRLSSFGHNLMASYELNDNITFKNILAYRKSKVFVTSQLDGLGGLVNSVVRLGTTAFPASFLNSNTALRTTNTTAPFVLVANSTNNREHQWSDEFQVNIDTEWFQLTAGYLHFTNTQVNGGLPGTFISPLFQAINGQGTSSANTPGVILGNAGYIPSRIKVTSDAVFVQPQFHITDRLDIVGGARITRDRKKGFEIFPDQSVARANTGLPSPVSSPINYRDSEQTFLVGINYRPTDNVLTYAKYSDGFISGGQLATIAFKPEHAYSYEAGIKADLFDRRWRSNLAVYHADYKSIQYTTSGTLTGIPSSFLFASAVVSQGDAKADGFEWENTIVPVRGLTLTANVGYTDFKFDNSTIFPGFVLTSGAGGYRAIQRPKWTGNLAAQYESEPLFAGGHLMLRMDANFRSKMLMSTDVSPGSGPTAAASQVLIDSATTPFQWVVNGRAGIADIEVGNSKVDVGIWGRNIFNNRNITQYVAFDLAAVGSVSSVLYERAPTYGVDLTFAF